MNSFAQMITDLKGQVIHPGASNESRINAIQLAYEIGEAQGRHAGKIEGLTEMHDANLKSLNEIFAKVKS